MASERESIKFVPTNKVYGGSHTLSLINTYDFEGHRLRNYGQFSDRTENVGK